MQIIETQRLIIRNWESSDANSLINIVNKPNIQKWLLDWDNPEEWIAKWIENVRNHYIKDSPINDFISWAIILKETNGIIGQINIGGDEFDNKEVEVAYFIDDSFTNLGYATEATEAIVDCIFQRYGYTHINAIIQPQNYGSIATVKKLGFKYIETIEKQLTGHSYPLLFDVFRLDNIKV